MSTATTRTDPELSGYCAYWDAFALESNPYLQDTPASKEWIQGFHAGRREDLEDREAHGEPPPPMTPTR